MPRGKNKHMTIEDRVKIQGGVEQGRSISAIARDIGVSASTVSRELKANRTRIFRDSPTWNPCAKKASCKATGICGGCEIAGCKACHRVRCWEVCEGYEERACDLLRRAPFVCAGCHRFPNCRFVRARYTAVEAQLAYERRLVETREGISLSSAELESLVRLVKARLVQGWSLEAIWAVHRDLMPVSARTLRSYVDAGLMGLANIDLPRKVRFKPRKAISGHRLVDRDGRSYSDFCDLPDEVRSRHVQMDTVVGRRGDFKCILTVMLPKTRFQMMVLLEEHTCECVVGALDWIETIIGTAEFARLFGVILTDRGIEFCDFEAIERSCLSNARRCRVFYCDPMRSDQKGACERNHVELRRVIPKKTSLEGLTAFDVATVCTHVNNYPRASLGGKTPYSLAARLLPKELLEELGISRLRADEVTLRPSLLGKTSGR